LALIANGRVIGNTGKINFIIKQVKYHAKTKVISYTNVCPKIQPDFMIFSEKLEIVADFR
jgi:hypothetical protein